MLHRFFTILLLILVATPMVLAQSRIALLRESSGQVTVDGKPAKNYQTLTQGAKLKLGPGATARIDYLKTGVRHEVQGPTEVSIAASGVEGKGVSTSTSSRLSLVTGSQKQGAVKAVRPTGEDVTLDVHWDVEAGQPRPTFELIELSAVDERDFELVIVDTPFQADLGSGRVTYQGPPLEVGRLYKASIEEGFLSHIVEFQVPSPEEVVMLEESQKELRQLATDTQDPTPLLLLVKLLKEHGLHYRASQVADELMPQLSSLDEETQVYFLKNAVEVYSSARRFGSASRSYKRYLELDR